MTDCWTDLVSSGLDDSGGDNGIIAIGAQFDNIRDLIRCPIVDNWQVYLHL